MLLNKDTVVRTIYHFGDVHIRKNNVRDKEYEDIFQKMCSKISDDTKNSLIVCTGDIFHDGLSPSAIILAKNFFVKLCEMCDVVVFRGNHDQAAKSNAETMDFLFPILYKLETRNKIHILDKTGFYEYGNIVFGYTDVYERHVLPMDGYDEKIKIGSTKHERIKIGLWHGTISGSKNDDGWDLSERAKFTTSDFDGYDYVMLGDVHKAQYINKKKTIAYPGSLIQQNYGETLERHGYIKWNLVKKTSTHVGIDNDCGFVTIEIKDEKVKDIPEELPANVNLRIIHSGTSDEYIKTIYAKVSEQTTIVNFEDRKEQIEFAMSEPKNEETKEVDNDDTIIERLIKYIEDNCEQTDCEKKEITDILRSAIGELKYNYEIDKKSIKLKSLIFNNFNVYGGGNCVDYEEMKGIINVCGKNGIGKSSIAVHVLLYAIYGLCEESSIGKYDYINNKKHDMVTSVILDVNGIEYRILRTAFFKDKKRTTRNFSHGVTLYKNNVDVSGKDVSETNKNIIDIVGSSDDLINLCIMEQKKSTSFLNLSDTEKKDYICNLLKMDVYNNIHDVLAHEVRTYNAEISSHNKRIYDNPKSKTSNRTTLVEQEVEVTKFKMQQLETEKEKVNGKYLEVNKEKIEKEMKISELEKLDFENISTEKNINRRMQKVQKQLDALRERMDDINVRIDKNNRKITSYKGIQKTKKIFDKKRDAEIEKLNSEINELWKGYSDVADEANDWVTMGCEKQTLEKTKMEMDTKIRCIEEKMDELKQKNDAYDRDATTDTGYSKYQEMLLENARIDEREKVILSKINDASDALDKYENQYAKAMKNLDGKKREHSELLEKIKENGNIEENNNKFESDKSNKISKLMNDIQEKMKLYEKIIDVDDVDEGTIGKLRKNTKGMEAEIKNIDGRIEELNEQTVKMDKSFEKKYTVYAKFNKEREVLETEMISLTKKLNEYNEHLELLKNHRYNVKCEVCMSNDITKDKIATEKMIHELNEQIGTHKKLQEKNDSKCKMYEKYGEMKLVSDKNQEIMKLIQEEEKLKEKLSIRIETNKMRIKMLNKQHAEFADNARKVKVNKQIDAFVSGCNERIKKLQSETFEGYETFCQLKEKEQKLNEAILNLNGEVHNYEKMQKDKEDYELKLKSVREERKGVGNKYSEFTKYGEMREEYQKNVTLLKNTAVERDTMHNALEKIINRIDKITLELESHNKILEIIKNNEKISHRISGKKSELECKKNEICEEYEKYVKLRSDNEKLQSEYSVIHVQVKDLEMKLIALRKEYDDNKEMIQKKSAYDKLKLDIVVVNDEFEKLSQEMEKMNTEKSEINTRLCELKSELKSIRESEEAKTEIERKKTLNLKIIDVIKNGFVENLLTKRIIPNFCASVNSILSSFVDYKISMEYNNKKIFVYKEDTHGLLSCASKLSGYETIMANIAFRLAINNINKLYKTNFFIIDEAFAFCDEQSIANISNLFAYMRKIYDFVIVVSHNEQIKSYTDIDIPIQIRDGFSYVNMINKKNRTKFIQFAKLLDMKEEIQKKKF